MTLAESFLVTRAQYWLINGASLFVALLIATEILSVHQLDNVTTLVEHAQLPLLQAQQATPQVQALVQRTAVGATRDPALKDLLQKYGISVTMKSAPSAEATATAPAPSPIGAQLSSTPAANSSPATP